MTTLNITFDGLSADYPGELDPQTSDADIRRIAVETVQSGSLPGLHRPDMAASAFDNFVVDRYQTPQGAPRIFLRPKVPFGAPAKCAVCGGEHHASACPHIQHL